jgi:tetratricopeptide (TPR) repeat protein
MKQFCLLVLVPLLLVTAACNRDPAAQAQRYVENGNKFFEKEKFKEASIMYRRALQKDLRFGEAYYRLGLTELKLGRFLDAQRALRRAVELQPENQDAATKLADLYLLALANSPGKIPPAFIAEFKDLVAAMGQKFPDSFDAQRLQGHAALLDQNLKDALKFFEKANQTKPLQPELVTILFQALVADKQNAAAEKLAAQMIEKDKTFSPIYDLLFLLRLRSNDPAGAEAVLKQKVANNPKKTDFHIQLASFYYAQKRRPELEAIIQNILSKPDEHPDAYLLSGNFFQRVREYDRARQVFEQGSAKFPNDKGIYQKAIAQVLVLDNKPAEAARLIEEIIKADPKDDVAIQMRAALTLQSGNREEINRAAADLQALVTKTPDNAVLRYELARALIAKNEADAARVQLEESIKLRPNFLPARETLGRLYLLRGETGKALKEADEILQQSANYLPARLIRSSALIAMKEHDRARQELSAILAQNPDNPEAKYQVGFLNFTTGQFAQAESIFRQLYKDRPNDPRGLVGIVESYVAMGRFNDAVQIMDSEINKDPKRRDLKLALANVLVRGTQYDRAILIYQELLKDQPDSGDLMYKLAETYRRKGDLNSATDWLRKASDAMPNNPDPLLMLAMVLEGTGKRDQAKPLYEKVLRLQPDQEYALNNLAYIKAEEGVDLDTALTMAQRARQKRPDNNSIADTLGWIYIKKNLSDDAVRIFTELVSKEPKNPTFHYHLGMALMQKGDKAAARKALEVALQNNPPAGEAAKIRELLAN